MRVAGPADVDRLVGVMAEFYAESGFPVDRPRAATAFETLVTDERLGRVWILEAEGREAGYAVLTLGFSMEFGGRDAFLDDLFVRPEFRSRGLGGEAIDAARTFCAERGVRALHLEVGDTNDRAHELYRRAGFVDHDRRLMTLTIADPLHVTADTKTGG